jgi:catechol 2,3-dioxygenase-like lactoylglutathione lyase family enzyme
MERFIDRLIDEFDSGKLSRREFCETMAVATAVLAAGGAAANAAPQSGFTMLGVNHLSYACPDYRMARDFYRDVFGMQVVNDKGMGRANLAFGPAPDNGGNFLVVHNESSTPRPPTQGYVDHICFTVANWNEPQIKSELAAQGLAQRSRGGNGTMRVLDPFDFDIQFGNHIAENINEP